MALYLHRVLRSDPDRPLHAMNHFFSPWMLLVLLVVPVLLAWRFVRVGDAGRGAGDDERGTRETKDKERQSGETRTCPFILHPSSLIIHHFSPVPCSSPPV